MFQNIKDFFSHAASLEVKRDGEPSQEELRVGVAALLFEIVGADGRHLQVEASAISDMLSQAFNLSDYDTELLVLIASQESARGRLPEYLRAIREHYSRAQRERILELADKLVFIDGKLDMGEAVTRDLFSYKLGLNDS